MTRDAATVRAVTHRKLLVLLGAPLLGLCLATACGGEKKEEGPSAEEKQKKANEVCGADEAAKKDADACKKCCKDNGVGSYMWNGMDNSCSCSGL